MAIPDTIVGRLEFRTRLRFYFFCWPPGSLPPGVVLFGVGLTSARRQPLQHRRHLADPFFFFSIVSERAGIGFTEASPGIILFKSSDFKALFISNFFRPNHFLSSSPDLPYRPSCFSSSSRPLRAPSSAHRNPSFLHLSGLKHAPASDDRQAVACADERLRSSISGSFSYKATRTAPPTDNLHAAHPGVIAQPCLRRALAWFRTTPIDQWPVVVMLGRP